MVNDASACFALIPTNCNFAELGMSFSYASDLHIFFTDSRWQMETNLNVMLTVPEDLVHAFEPIRSQLKSPAMSAKVKSPPHPMRRPDLTRIPSVYHNRIVCGRAALIATDRTRHVCRATGVTYNLSSALPQLKGERIRVGVSRLITRSDVSTLGNECPRACFLTDEARG